MRVQSCSLISSVLWEARDDPDVLVLFSFELLRSKPLICFSLAVQQVKNSDEGLLQTRPSGGEGSSLINHHSKTKGKTSWQ